MIDTQKLQVLEVESWSPAYKQGTRTGCMVTHVNQHPVNDWDDYTRLAKNENEFDLILKFKSADQHRHAVVRFHAVLGTQCVYAGGASNLSFHSLILAHVYVGNDATVFWSKNTMLACCSATCLCAAFSLFA